MHINVVNLYDTLLAIYFNDCNSITDEEIEEMGKKYDPSNLFPKGYKYDKWDKKLDETTESYEDESKSQPEETVAKTGKLILQERKIQKESDDTKKSVIPTMQPPEGDEEEVNK